MFKTTTLLLLKTQFSLTESVKSSLPTGTLTNNGQGTVTITTGGGGGGGSGTVTSVTLNAATTGLTISGGTSQTITTSGTFTLGGKLVPANGGTGMNTYNKGDLIVGGTTNPLETLGTGGRTAGDFLTIKGWTYRTSMVFCVTSCQWWNRSYFLC